MKHVDAFETTDLPEDLGREFVADAPCVAVLVEASQGAGGGESDGPPSGRRETPEGEPSARASVTVYRVGDGYVADCTAADGTPRTVGMGAGQFESYVERVQRDDEWTVLSIADEGFGARRERPAGDSRVGR